MIGQYLADQFAAELDDEEVHSVLQQHGAEALEEAGDPLLLEDGGEAVGDPLIPVKSIRYSVFDTFSKPEYSWYSVEYYYSWQQSYLVRMGVTSMPLSRLSMMLLVPWRCSLWSTVSRG